MLLVREVWSLILEPGPMKHHKGLGLKHRKGGLQINVLNTAKNDKGLDNPNLTLI